MKKIYFLPSERETAYQTYNPETNGTVEFKRDGGYYDVPDSVADHLLADRPELFGNTLAEIKIARGEKPRQETERKKPGRKKKTLPRGKKPAAAKETPQPKPSHPFVRGMKKTQDTIDAMGKQGVFEETKKTEEDK